jgi:tRNA threonylcarbamoyladenosine modification (KEOPS) complex Cgi121 subunit
MMLAYEAAASEIHLWTAWYALRRGEDSGKMIANTPDTEFLRLVSGTHQINKAFERAGISVNDKCAWLVMLPDLELGGEFGDFSIPPDSYNDGTEEAIRLIERIGGSLIPNRPIPSTIGLERIGAESFEGANIAEIEDFFLGHIALSDLK